MMNKSQEMYYNQPLDLTGCIFLSIIDHPQVYEDLGQYTKANLFRDPSQKTPVFVRFSNVAGSRGSADTVRDVRGTLFFFFFFPHLIHFVPLPA